MEQFPRDKVEEKKATEKQNICHDTFHVAGGKTWTYIWMFLCFHKQILEGSRRNSVILARGGKAIE